MNLEAQAQAFYGSNQQIYPTHTAYYYQPSPYAGTNLYALQQAQIQAEAERKAKDKRRKILTGALIAAGVGVAIYAAKRSSSKPSSQSLSSTPQLSNLNTATVSAQAPPKESPRIVTNTKPNSGVLTPVEPVHRQGDTENTRRVYGFLNSPFLWENTANEGKITKIEVNTNTRTLEAYSADGQIVYRSEGVVTGRNGVRDGSERRRGDNTTPLGDYELQHKTSQTLGDVLALMFYTGGSGNPDTRKEDIYIHASAAQTTRGCVGVPRALMDRLLQRTENGARIQIR